MSNDLDAYLDPAPKPRRGNYDEIINRHSQRTGLDPTLVKAVMGQESGGNPRARSPKNAQGLMQLIPATAKRFGVKNVYDPEENIRGGTDYLKFLNDRFKGDRDLVLAGYNAGEGAVEKYGNRIPPYRETQNYVKSINQKLGQPQKPQGELDQYLDPLEDYLDKPAPAPTPTPRRSPFAGVKAGVRGVSPQTIEAPGGFEATAPGQPGVKAPPVRGSQPARILAGLGVDPRITTSLLGKPSPEEQAAEAARQQRVSQMGTGEYLAQIPKSAVGGLAGSVGTGLKSIAALSRKINLGNEYEGKETKDLATYRLGEYITKKSKELVGSNPDLEQEFFVGKTPNTIGQVAQFMLGGWATKSPKLAVVVLGSGMTAGDAYDEVRARGGSDEEAVNAGLLAGAILGPTELIGLRGMTKALSGTVREATLKAAMKTALREGKRDAIENALQEVGQEFGQGIITKNPRTGRQLAEAGALGAIGGTATAPLTLATQIGGRRAQAATTPETAADDAGTVVRDTGASIRGDVPPRRGDGERASIEPSRTGGSVESVVQEPLRRFYHRDWGEVVKLEDQSGARKGRTKVAEVDNPEAIHFPKTADLTGKGNQRLVPIKETKTPDLEQYLDPQSRPEASAEPATPVSADRPPEALPVEAAKVASPSEKPFFGNLKQGQVSGFPDPQRAAEHASESMIGGERWRYEPTTKTVYWATESSTQESRFTVENWLDRRGQAVETHEPIAKYDRPAIIKNLRAAQPSSRRTEAAGTAARGQEPAGEVAAASPSEASIPAVREGEKPFNLSEWLSSNPDFKDLRRTADSETLLKAYRAAYKREADVQEEMASRRKFGDLPVDELFPELHVASRLRSVLELELMGRGEEARAATPPKPIEAEKLIGGILPDEIASYIARGGTNKVSAIQRAFGVDQGSASEILTYLESQRFENAKPVNPAGREVIPSEVSERQQEGGIPDVSITPSAQETLPATPVLSEGEAVTPVAAKPLRRRQGESDAKFAKRKMLAQSQTEEGKTIQPKRPSGRAAFNPAKQSLGEAVRAVGGIREDKTGENRGEIRRVSQKETGTSGIVNKNSTYNAEDMALLMAEHGYRGDWVDVTMGPHGPQYSINGDLFLEALEADLSGIRKSYTGEEYDYEGEYAKWVESPEVQAKTQQWEAFQGEPNVRDIFQKLVDNGALESIELGRLREAAEKHGVTEEIEYNIEAHLRDAAEPEGDVDTSFDFGQSETRVLPGRSSSAPSQLGFVQEGLTQESANLPPKQVDQRERLIREDRERQAAANPERVAAEKTLAELKAKGMTVDDYANQGSLIGETPTPEKIALLRELESGTKHGPGTMGVGEPLPEVKERKFGKRFVEDERIVEELRESIGTAKYYEVAPNKITAEQAKTYVDKHGLGETWNVVRDENNNIPFHVRSAMGQGVILRLNRAITSLKETNPKAAEYALDRATDMAEWAMDFGTRLGQGVQSFAMWAKLSPEGKLLTYKRGVEKARQRQSKFFGEDVREIVETVNGKMTDAERLDALKQLFKTNKTARKARPEWEKILKAAKDGKLTDTMFYDIAGDRLGLPTYNKDVARRITDLALEIENAPEGMPKNRKIQALNDYLAEQKGFDVADLPLGIFYGNILSGYNTHAVNFADTALNVLSEVNGVAITNPRAAATLYQGLLRGAVEGRLDALASLTEGRLVTDGKWLERPRLMEIARFGQKGGVPIKPTGRAGRVMKSIAESKVGYPLNAYKYVTRAMMASDAVMFRSAKEARASLLAYRMAKADGLRGDALDTRVREILALDRMQDFKAQAEREGFTGREAEMRTAELREMARPMDLTSDAAEWAGEATYNHKPHGTFGLIAGKVAETSEAFKPLKLFVPFTQIVANVTNRGLNWTPYGYKRAAMGWGFGKNAEPLTPDARRQMYTRATLGTAGMVLMGTLQAAGVLQIHGNGPSDREKRRQLQNAGWRPYSLQIGDKYISYVYSPVGLGMSVLGNMSDAQRYHELQQKDIGTRGAYAIGRLGSTVFSQSFLSGLSRLFGALSEEPSRSVTAVKQVLGGTVSAFGIPNIVRDAHRLFDNKAYQSNTLMEDLIRSTPFAALALKPSLSAFGEPVRLQRQRFVDVQTSDPAWKFVVEKGLRVPVPSRTTEMRKGVRIIPDEYYQLLLTTGPKVKQWIVANRSRLTRMKEDDAQDELTQAAIRIRKFELARMRLLKARKKAA